MWVFFFGLDERTRTDSSATCRWHVADASANTGGYNYFLSPAKENVNRVLYRPPGEAAVWYILPEIAGLTETL